MFAADIIQRLNELDNMLIKHSDSAFYLEEEMEPDVARITVQLKNPSVLITELENNKFKYFKSQKCADFVIFEQVSDAPPKWGMHIFEFKRTVKCSEGSWSEHIAKQFGGAYHHGLCFSGFLNLHIKEIKVYTCHRFNKITGDNADPVLLRKIAQDPTCSLSRDVIQWHSGYVKIQTNYGQLEFIHKPIQVSDDFTAEYAI